MSKEIEDALHMLLHCSLKDTEYETQFEQYKIVRDYITNLQQENKQLKSYNKLCIKSSFTTRKLKELQQENKQLKEEKKKAIEHIKENTKNDTFCEWYDGEVKDLLEILGDKENE